MTGFDLDNLPPHEPYQARPASNAPASNAPASNALEYSVSEISRALKNTIENVFGHVKVKGELSSVKIATSGHGYMALKDQFSNDVLDAVCWRASMAKFGFRPEDGMEVIASGKLTSYGDRSKYQLIIEKLELAGQGALLQQLEERKRRLAAEGLFDQARKKPFPFLPEVIGVITSPTGSVIRDILHRLQDRFPRHVLVWPALVQGNDAADQIIAGIKGFNALPALSESMGDIPPRPDMIIIARGGGSLEDLWAFNDEGLVRAIAQSAIPIISAVGHETDTTLCDFVADMRAPTPTAAAEMAVPVRRDLINRVHENHNRMKIALLTKIKHHAQILSGWSQGLLSPEQLILQREQRLDDRFERLSNAAKLHYRQADQNFKMIKTRLNPPSQSYNLALQRLTQAWTRIEQILPNIMAIKNERILRTAERLEANSFKSVLARGYSVLFDQKHNLITSLEGLKSEDHLTALLKDDQKLGLKITSINGEKA